MTRILLSLAMLMALGGCNALVSREAYDRDLAGMKGQADQLEAQKKALSNSLDSCKKELASCVESGQKTVREREQCKDELQKTQSVLDQCTHRGGNCAKDLADTQMAKMKIEDELRKTKEDLATAQKERERLQKERDRLEKEQKALADALGKVQAGVKKVQDRLRALVDAGKLRIRSRDGLLVIEVNSDILFDLNKAEVKPAARPVLSEIASALRELNDRRFQIAGHTDDTGADQLNWRLSTDRSLAVLHEMVTLGVPAKLLSAAGFGPYSPMVPNDSVEARAKNRRVEFLLVPDLSGLFDAQK